VNISKTVKDTYKVNIAVKLMRGNSAFVFEVALQSSTALYTTHSAISLVAYTEPT